MRKMPEFTSAEAKRLWKKTLESFSLEEHHLRMLADACVCVDRTRAAAEAVRRDGAIVQDRYGCPKAHPALKVENDNKIIFARLIREIGLDLDAGPDTRLPRG